MHRPAPLAENSVDMRLSRLLEVQVGAGQCRSIPDPRHPSNSDLILRPSTTMLDPQTEYNDARFRFLPFKVPLGQSAIKVRGASGVLAHAGTVSAVFQIQLTGFLPVRRINLTALFQKLTHPVVLPAIGINGILDHLRILQMKILRDNALGTFDDPRKHCRASVLKKVIRIVLHVAPAFKHRIERNHDQPSPRALVRCTHLRQVVGVQDQGV